MLCMMAVETACVDLSHLYLIIALCTHFTYTTGLMDWFDTTSCLSSGGLVYPPVILPTTHSLCCSQGVYYLLHAVAVEAVFTCE